jgi:hypothetical protein
MPPEVCRAQCASLQVAEWLERQADVAAESGHLTNNPCGFTKDGPAYLSFVKVWAAKLTGATRLLDKRA